jgi:two-component system NtrC family response regulator
MSDMILIVDDDASVITSLALLLKQAGYQSVGMQSPGDAILELKKNRFQLVLQDMNFTRQTSGEEGLALLRQIKLLHPELPVILMTAWASVSLAVQGIKSGASDFITKPWTNEQLLQSVRTSIGLAAVASNHNTSVSREELDNNYDFKGIVGKDPKLLHILDIVGRVSATDASVLITGESGTGKELIAEAIHKNSHRKDKPFIKVNLGGISASLFESEMFGHVRGAFTGAQQDRKGRFEVANNGTIFLDEIGDLDETCQVKLLRVLQDRTYEVVGSSASRVVDVRVISATNADLLEMIGAGEFREDLLYRLNLIALHLPSLRERRDDIPLLANHFLENVANIYRRPHLSISEKALQWLQQVPWHGNIRQLKHTIERAVLMTSKNVLDIEDFRMPLTTAAGEIAPSALPPAGSITLEEMERAMITKCMTQFGGNVSKVAEALGLSRAALYRRLEKFGISS